MAPQTWCKMRSSSGNSSSQNSQGSKISVTNVFSDHWQNLQQNNSKIQMKTLSSLKIKMGITWLQPSVALVSTITTKNIILTAFFLFLINMNLTCLFVVLDCSCACSEVWEVVVGRREWITDRGVRCLPNRVVPDVTPWITLHTSSHWFPITLQAESQHVVKAWWVLALCLATDCPSTTATIQQITLLQHYKERDHDGNF